MSVGVVGAGAIGLMFAAEAALAGNEVIVCSRTDFDGVEVTDSTGVRRAEVRVITDPSDASPVDWVFIATKAHDVEAAREWIDRLSTSKSTIVVFQNGVEHEETVGPIVGPAVSLLPALVYMSSHRTAPGRITHTQGNSVVVPATPDGERFAGLLGEGSITVQQESDFLTASWLKLLTNGAANPLTALTERPIGVIKRPDVRRLAADMLSEAIAVGQAEGAKLFEEHVEKTLAYYSSADDSNRTSMLDDRLGGRPLEHEHLTGVVVRKGKQHGIDVPTSEVIRTLLAALSEPAELGRR